MPNILYSHNHDHMIMCSHSIFKTEILRWTQLFPLDSMGTCCSKLQVDFMILRKAFCWFVNDGRDVFAEDDEIMSTGLNAAAPVHMSALKPFSSFIRHTNNLEYIKGSFALLILTLNS